MSNIPFTRAEYAERFAQVKGRMAIAGFDLIVCQDPANMGWLTGFDGWSFYVPQCVLVHRDEETPIWFGRAQDAKSAHLTTYLPAKNIVPFSEHLIQHPVGHPYDELAELIRARGWSKARIGVEMDAHYYTARCHAHLTNGLPEAAFSNNGDLVNWARLVKSDAELVLMREAGQICSHAMNRAIEVMRPGVPQYQVIAEIYHAQTIGVPGAGGDYAAICPLMPVGEGTSTPHLTWSDAPLPTSGLAMLEIAGARRRYHAPLTRTIHLGKPPQAITDVAKAVVEGVDAGLAKAKSGNTAAEVEGAWQAVLRKHGLKKESRVGYSIGLAYPPDWGERTVSLRPGDETALQAGMCFHIQSGVWLQDFGVAISESFVVTDTGGERLCDVARELIVID
ncbi:M24 family metallopeptidase [Aestuariivirga sp. YIM B02566]|uniref:M24 family metallopeptidase n=1 Tax=Taklimakanibacter albus TaxID=2800327 RepID=A0ACC5R8K2_9HYPH|nr:M24 family metallopeptidase [Aestuariivirga sp. YIM B02566]MBK1868855.1 M24 family metallopeptidase [Aestuariivirga sp. YIM B02566]